MIEIRELAVTYPGGVRAVKPTSLRFARGEFTVLLGASGAGKSTLLRCLNGLVSPTGGSVIAEGCNDLTRARELRHHRRRTGMIFQQHQLIGRLSVLRNVLMGRLGYHGTLRSLFPASQDDHEIAFECIERVGLLEKALEPVRNLSGGQQQRAGSARALAQKPTIMLADEPVASLDPATAVQVLSLISDVCRQDQITAVVSLHQVDLARQFADRVIGISAGEVVFDGRSGDLDDASLARIYQQQTTPDSRRRATPSASQDNDIRPIASLESTL